MTLHPVADRPVALRAAGRSVTPRWAAVALVAAVALGAALSLLVGSRAVPVGDVWAAVTAYDPTNPMQAIVAARIPRTVVALLAGGALGLAGASMQGLTRNPLADPGHPRHQRRRRAGHGAGHQRLRGHHAERLRLVRPGRRRRWPPFLVHAIAGLGRDGATPVKLAVAGAALTAGMSSWTTGLLLTNRQTLDVFRFWQVGTVGGRSMDVVWPVLPILVVGAVLALTGARLLNVLALGDDLARGLGRRAGLDRVVVGVAIVRCAVAPPRWPDPLVFVGLVAPHVARMVVGSDYSRILPVSLGLGAVLVLFADILGRVVAAPDRGPGRHHDRRRRRPGLLRADPARPDGLAVSTPTRRAPGPASPRGDVVDGRPARHRPPSPPRGGRAGGPGPGGAFLVRVLLGDFTVTFPDFVRILARRADPRRHLHRAWRAKLPRAVLGVLVGRRLRPRRRDLPDDAAQRRSPRPT